MFDQDYNLYLITFSILITCFLDNVGRGNMLITSESSEGLTPRCDLYVTYTYNFYKLSSKRLDAICNLIALVI